MGGPPNFQQRCFGNGTTPTTNVVFAASPRLLGRTSPGGGPGEEISVDATLDLVALTLSRKAISGDVVVPAGSNAATIQPNVVSNSKLAQMPALTVKANPTNALANAQDLTGTTVGQVLQVVAGPLLAFDAPPVPGAGTVPLSSLANAAAQFDIIGRKSAGAGVWEDCTRTQLNLAGTDLANVFSAVQTVQQATTGILLQLTSTDAGAGGGPDFSMFRDSATPASGDIGARFLAIFRDSGGASVTSQLRWAIIDANAATFTTQVQLTQKIAGTAGVIGIQISNGIQIGSPVGGYLGNGSLNVQTVVRTGQFTVATLPAAATVGAGARAYVTDAFGPAFGAAVVGGGAVGTPVYSTGAAWNVG